MSKPLTNDVSNTVIKKQRAELREKMGDSMDRLDQKMKCIEELFASSAREILAHKQASDDRILAAIEDLLVLRSRCMGLLLLTVVVLAGGLWRAGLL